LHFETNSQILILSIEGQVFMKKKVVIFTLLIVSAVLVLFNMRPEKKDPRFVSMKDGAFFLH